MADVELVIKIPERDYYLACNYPDALIATYAYYIKDGKILPKGHGKLKDEKEIIECIENRVRNLMNDTQFMKYRKDIDLLGTIPHIRNEVKTIIEADEGSEETDAVSN